MSTPEKYSPEQLLEKPTTLGFIDPDVVGAMTDSVTACLPKLTDDFTWTPDGNVTKDNLYDAIFPFAEVVVGSEVTSSGSPPSHVVFTVDVRPALPGQTQRFTPGWHLDRPYQEGYSIIFSSDLPMEFLQKALMRGKDIQAAQARLLNIWRPLQIFQITDPQISTYGMKVATACNNELLSVRKTLHRSQRNPTRSTIPKLFLRASVTPAITDLSEAA